MAIHPMELLKFRERLQIFQQQHGRFPLFLQDVGAHAVAVGTIVEMKVIDGKGKEYVTNIRLTPEDIETIEMAKGLGKR